MTVFNDGNITHQFAGPWYSCDYTCPDCGEVWTEEWSCACNGACPNCGVKDIEPVRYERIDELAEWLDAEMEDEYEYDNPSDCNAAGVHLDDCDDDGYCNLCGHDDPCDDLDGPAPGDYTITPCGSLGGKTALAVVEGLSSVSSLVMKMRFVRLSHVWTMNSFGPTFGIFRIMATLRFGRGTTMNDIAAILRKQKVKPIEWFLWCEDTGKRLRDSNGNVKQYRFYGWALRKADRMPSDYTIVAIYA